MNPASLTGAAYWLPVICAVIIGVRVRTYSRMLHSRTSAYQC